MLETGEAYLIDLLTNRAGTFVVSRIPLRDESNAVIGAIGIVLFDPPETTLAPLISKFALMQRNLDDARRELATQRLSLANVKDAGARPAKFTFASFIGTSPSAVEVKRQARRAAQSSCPVLLLGETGTGKELLAHAIHAASVHAGGPLSASTSPPCPTRCWRRSSSAARLAPTPERNARAVAAISRSPTVARCSWTKSATCRSGLQAKLLRALQEGEIEPMGFNQLRPVEH